MKKNKICAKKFQIKFLYLSLKINIQVISQINFQIIPKINLLLSIISHLSMHSYHQTPELAMHLSPRSDEH